MEYAICLLNYLNSLLYVKFLKILICSNLFNQSYENTIKVFNTLKNRVKVFNIKKHVVSQNALVNV